MPNPTSSVEGQYGRILKLKHDVVEVNTELISVILPLDPSLEAVLKIVNDSDESDVASAGLAPEDTQLLSIVSQSLRYRILGVHTDVNIGKIVHCEKDEEAWWLLEKTNS